MGLTENQARQLAELATSRRVRESIEQALGSDGQEEGAGGGRGRRGSKYGAVRCEVDGIRYDSKFEAQVGQELIARERAGEITNLVHQYRIGYTGDSGGVLFTYLADFAWEVPGIPGRVYLDVKGIETDIFKLKTKLLADRGIFVYTYKKDGKYRQAFSGHFDSEGVWISGRKEVTLDMIEGRA